MATLLLALPSHAQQSAQAAPESPPTHAASESPLPDPYLDLTLSELLEVDLSVSAATKTVTTTVDEAPAVLHVTTRADIERYGYRSIGDALANVPGLFVVDDLVTANVGIRGITGGPDSWSRHVKVMIDGVPAHDYATGGALLGPEFIDMGIVERIEVISGPASALYGANALLGVINVITRAPQDPLAATLTTHTGATRWRQFSSSVSAQIYAKTANRFPLSLTASAMVGRLDRSGLAVPETSPAAEAHRGSKSEADSSRPRSVMGKLEWDLARAGRFTAMSVYQHLNAAAQFSATSALSRHNRLAKSNWISSFAHRVTLWSRGDQSEQSRSRTLRDMAQAQGDGATRHELRWHSWVELFRGQNLPQQVFDTGSGSSLTQRQRSSRSLGVGTELSYQWGRSSALLGFDHLRIAVSGDGLVDIDRRTGSRSIRNIPTPSQQNIAGLFAQLILHPIRRLAITSGLRLDHSDRWGNILSVRAAAILRLGHAVHLKALYGSSFVPPSPSQLHALPLTLAGGVKGNPDLESQRARTPEFSVIVRPWQPLRLELNFFYTKVRNRVEFVQHGGLRVAENQAGSQSLGGSLVATLDWKLLNISGDLSLQRTRVETPHSPSFLWYIAYHDRTPGGLAASNYPAVLARLRAGLRLPKQHLSLALSAMLAGRRKSSVDNIVAQGNIYFLPAYLTLGAHIRTLGIQLIPNRDTFFALHFNNLTNQDYSHGGSLGVDIPAQGVSVWLSLTQNL